MKPAKLYKQTDGDLVLDDGVDGRGRKNGGGVNGTASATAADKKYVLRLRDMPAAGKAARET
jgi:hypothetical protein